MTEEITVQECYDRLTDINDSLAKLTKAMLKQPEIKVSPEFNVPAPTVIIDKQLVAYTVSNIERDSSDRITSFTITPHKG